MKETSAPTSRSAFTLIELLTVIAIIGVLAAILIPSIQGVRTRAQETKKSSNYRQYYAANLLYANDNGGNTVPAKDARVEADQLWHGLLAPYLQDRASYSNKGEIFVDTFFTGYDPEKSWITGAGVNVKVKLPQSNDENVFWNEDKISDGKEFKLNQITYPGKRIFIGDSSNWFISKDTFSTDRHDDGTKGMFVLFDGSVEMLTAEEAGLAINDPSKR